MPREMLFNAYKNTMVEYLCRMTNRNVEECDKFVEDVVRKEMRSDTVTHVQTTSYGNTKVVKEPLWKFVYKHRDHVITPSGSIYKSDPTKRSVISQMAMDKLKERGVVKKKMFKAIADGDKTKADQYMSAQATIKINLNSLPGGYGSPYNLFYDKGNYNAITSLARALIAYSYTVAEQFLGGNFPLYDEEMVINHILVNIPHAPSKEEHDELLKWYGLKLPTKRDLLEFYQNTVSLYSPDYSLPNVSKLLDTVTQEQITYLYYLGNMKHVVWENETQMRQWIDELFKLVDDKTIDPTIDPNDLHKIDEDLTVMLTVMFDDYLKESQERLGDKKKPQPYELPDKDPDLARRFVKVAAQMTKKLEAMNKIFDTFIFYPSRIPRINISQHMLRNTVVISDTDSVIFTSKDWVEWYAGDVTKPNKQSYQMASLVIYWLTKVMNKALFKYSEQFGAKGDYRYRMEMKNEILYITLILYGHKKTYAGLQAIKEGVVLPEKEVDIKGGNLRSSKNAEDTLAFIKEFINKDILEASTDTKLSAVQLINKVVKFENKIRKSLMDGESTFLQVESYRTKEEYKGDMPPKWFYYLAWTNVFGAQYGSLNPPSKAPTVPILTPTVDYMETLKKKNAKIHKNLVKFLDEYGKFPNALPLNPDAPVIPVELRPIMDIRHIIHMNMKSIYRTLERLGLSPGMEKQKLLLSDLH